MLFFVNPPKTHTDTFRPCTDLHNCRQRFQCFWGVFFSKIAHLHWSWNAVFARLIRFFVCVTSQLCEQKCATKTVVKIVVKWKTETLWCSNCKGFSNLLCWCARRGNPAVKDLRPAAQALRVLDCRFSGVLSAYTRIRTRREFSPHQVACIAKPDTTRVPGFTMVHRIGLYQNLYQNLWYRSIVRSPVLPCCWLCLSYRSGLSAVGNDYRTDISGL